MGIAIQRHLVRGLTFGGAQAMSGSTDRSAPGGSPGRLGLWLTLPAQLLLLAVAVFPLLMQLYLSFTDWTPLSGLPWTRAHELWAGLWNYTDLFADPRLHAALGRTLLVIVVAVPIEFALGLGLATLFVQDFPGKRVAYSVLLVPMMIVPAVAGYMFYLLFQSGGPINGLLSLFTSEPVTIAWLSDPTLAMVAVIVADVWQWTPLMFLILLAGLLGVPDDQMKAATLLGASTWQRFRTIALPKIRAIIVIALAIRTVEIFKIFDTLFIMTQGGPGVATETISVFIYKITQLELAWSYVAAVGLVILIALSVVAFVAIAFMPGARERKRGGEGEGGGRSRAAGDRGDRGVSAIHLEDLVKRFGDFTAIRAMELSVADGEFMALLGPSGCGKSTTMNIIAGMEAPTEGRVRFDERDVTRVPMAKRGVGFVFQNYAIFTHMSVRENLAYGLRMHGVARAERERRVREIADFLELGAFLDQPSAGLSVNILQRLAIGRSAVLEPAIFLLDEPLSNVDAAFRSVMRSELKNLQRRFRQTMVYVTHDQLEAMTMADRIAVMDHGVLQQVGTPLEVYNEPANLFVARFIGSPGMNLLDGRLEEREGRMHVELPAIGQSVALDEADAAAARGAPAAEIVYGFRPEEVALGDAAPIRLPVGFVERIGSRTVLHLGEGGAAKAVFQGDAGVGLNDVARFVPNPGTVRLFDRASGRRLEAARG